LCSTLKKGTGYFVEMIIRTPNTTMAEPPTSLTASIAPSEALERTVWRRTPMAEKTRVNPRTKNAELRNTCSLDLSASRDISLGHATLCASIGAFASFSRSTALSEISM